MKVKENEQIRFLILLHFAKCPNFSGIGVVVLSTIVRLTWPGLNVWKWITTENIRLDFIGPMHLLWVFHVFYTSKH